MGRRNPEHCEPKHPGSEIFYHSQICRIRQTCDNNLMPDIELSVRVAESHIPDCIIFVYYQLSLDVLLNLQE